MPLLLYSCNHDYAANGAGQPPAGSGHSPEGGQRLRDARGDRGGLRWAHADRAGELAAEGGRHDLDVLAWLRRLDHPAVAQVDRDMRDVLGRGRIGVVKEQVTRL